MKRKMTALFIIIAVIMAAAIAFVILRKTARIPELGSGEICDAYTEEEKALRAIAFSYFCYGCENSGGKTGSVGDILDNTKMGIVYLNFGLKRSEPDNPETAVFDTAGYIRKYAGDCRFLLEMKDSASGFYGAAFADDGRRCVWVAYSGSVDFADAMSCVAFTVFPRLSKQEKYAYEFAAKVLETDEVKGGYSVIFTGHSLGGGLAAEISLTSGYEAVSVNGAVGIAYDKISGITGKKYGDNRVRSYLTSNRNGRVSFMDFIESLMFLGSYKAADCTVYPENGLTEDTHCAFAFVGYEDGQFGLPKN